MERVATQKANSLGQDGPQNKQKATHAYKHWLAKKKQKNKKNTVIQNNNE